MLLFKKKFHELIRSGAKTQTVRLWKSCRFRPGGRGYIPGIGYIRITAADAVELADLTDDDARLDGFDSADALRKEIRALYVDRLDAGYRAFRVRFRLMEADEVEREAAPRSTPADATGVAAKPAQKKDSQAKSPRR